MCIWVLLFRKMFRTVAKDWVRRTTKCTKWIATEHHSCTHKAYYLFPTMSLCVYHVDFSSNSSLLFDSIVPCTKYGLLLPNASNMSNRREEFECIEVFFNESILLSTLNEFCNGKCFLFISLDLTAVKCEPAQFCIFRCDAMHSGWI